MTRRPCAVHRRDSAHYLSMFGVNGRLDESVAAALDCDYGPNERKLVRQASPFNGICEPIVGTPRDAIRGFGAGLDVLVLDRFVLTK